MMKNYLLGLAFTIFSVTSLAANITTSQWQNDIDFLVNQLPEQHYDFFKKHSAKKFNLAVEQLKQKLPDLNDHQIIVALNQLVAMARDGHTFIRGYHPVFDNEFGEGLHFKSVPIRFYAFEDGLYIYATHQSYQQYLGAKLLSVNGHSVEAAMDKVATMFSVENAMTTKSWAVYGLSTPKILHALNLSEHFEQASYQILLNGKVQEIVLSEVAQQPREKLGWVNDSNWQTTGNTSPMYLQYSDKIAWVEYLNDQQLIYLQINSLDKKAKKEIQQALDRATDLSKKHIKAKIVLDLRFNYGGETTLVNPIAKQLVASPANVAQNFYVITSRRTFSAASLLSTALQQYSYATFIGEPTGINEHFFGNARPNIKLPNSGLQIFAATSIWQPTNINFQQQWIAPELSTPLTYRDFVDGVDPAMTAIINKVTKQSIQPIIEQYLNKNISSEEFNFKYQEFIKRGYNFYVNSENALNELGYQLLAQQRYIEANHVFKLNVKRYSKSINAFDSLAESYIALEQKQNALKAYQKALQLEPESEYLLTAIQTLKFNVEKEP